MVHSAIGTAPSQVTDSEILAVWQRLNKRQSRVRTAKVKFRVGQHVRISKQKMKFEKAGKKIATQKYFG
jgi:uncharacterized protein YkuJ